MAALPRDGLQGRDRAVRRGGADLLQLQRGLCRNGGAVGTGGTGDLRGRW